MSVLARYISGRILVRFLLIAFGIAVFALSIELMDTADRIRRDHDGDVGVVLRYAGLRLPGLVLDFTPIATLLAALLTFGDLLRHRELVATWDIGVSPAGMIAKLLPLGLALGVFQAALNEAVVPLAAHELIKMGFRDEREGLLAGSAEGPLWLRHDRDVVRIGQGDGNDTIGPVAIFRLGDDGLLVERIEAERVDTMANGWRLENVVRYGVAPATVERLDELRWPALIETEAVRLLAADARTLPLIDLLRVLALADTGNRPTSLYVTWAGYRAVSPFAPALMIMLAVALAQRFERTGGLARLLVIGGSIGFGFFVLDRGAVALGEIGVISPWIAAAGASAALAGLIAWLVHEPRGRRAIA